jgi:hypothetical protein
MKNTFYEIVIDNGSEVVRKFFKTENEMLIEREFAILNKCKISTYTHHFE